jgi:hypothetical protein
VSRTLGGLGDVLFPVPLSLAALLDRLINSSHQVIMNGLSYRPDKRPKGPTGKPDTSVSGWNPLDSILSDALSGRASR